MRGRETLNRALLKQDHPLALWTKPPPPPPHSSLYHNKGSKSDHRKIGLFSPCFWPSPSFFLSLPGSEDDGNFVASKDGFRSNCQGLAESSNYYCSLEGKAGLWASSLALNRKETCSEVAHVLWSLELMDEVSGLRMSFKVG